jgi:putative hydrolase of the HAD superfamily
MKNYFFFFIIFFPLFSQAEESPPLPIVVFDFGGVVHKTDDAVLARKVKKTLKTTSKIAKKLVRKANAHENEPYFWEHFTSKAGTPLPPTWAQKFRKLKDNALRLDPRIVELIDRLKKKGCRVAMLSNVGSRRAEFIRKKGLYDPFNPVVLSCEIGADKPNKKAYLILLKKLGNVSAQNCLFIDDKKANIRAARALGFDAIRFHSVSDLRWELQIRQLLAPQPFKKHH